MDVHAIVMLQCMPCIMQTEHILELRKHNEKMKVHAYIFAKFFLFLYLLHLCDITLTREVHANIHHYLIHLHL